MVGALVARKTGNWRAGIAAAAWSGLLAAFLTLICLWMLTSAFLDVMDQVNVAEEIWRGSNWIASNVDDNLGGTFFTLFLFPGAGLVFGTIGALIGAQVLSFLQQTRLLRHP